MPQNTIVSIKKISNFIQAIDLPHMSFSMNTWLQLINCDRTQNTLMRKSISFNFKRNIIDIVVQVKMIVSKLIVLITHSKNWIDLYKHIRVYVHSRYFPTENILSPSAVSRKNKYWRDIWFLVFFFAIWPVGKLVIPWIARACSRYMRIFQMHTIFQNSKMHNSISSLGDGWVNINIMYMQERTDIMICIF